MPSAPRAPTGTQAVTYTAPCLPTSGALKVIRVVMVALVAVMVLVVAGDKRGKIEGGGDALRRVHRHRAGPRAGAGAAPAGKGAARVRGGGEGHFRATGVALGAVGRHQVGMPGIGT